MNKTSRMMMVAARGGQSRNSNGRYANGDMNGGQMNGSQMNYGTYRMSNGSGAEMNWGESNGSNRMYEENPLNGVDTQHQPYTHHSEHDPFHRPEERGRAGANANGGRMGGEGYFVWDRMEGNGAGNNSGGSSGNGGASSFYPHPPIYPYNTQMRNGNITSMHDYERQKSEQHQGQRMIGFGQEEGQGRRQMDREKAEHWVRKMKGIQIKMPYDEVKRRAENYGIEHEKIPEFYAVFNMMQSDYGMVAKEFGISTPDFFAAMAKAWMEDEDAVEGKTMLYKECIVKPQ